MKGGRKGREGRGEKGRHHSTMCGLSDDVCLLYDTGKKEKREKEVEKRGETNRRFKR